MKKIMHAVIIVLLGALTLPSLPSLPGDTDANRGTDEIRFNPYNSTWERARPTDELHFNEFNQGYRYRPEGYEEKFNNFDQEWE
jgi:hypothetical protein